jgi:hypothetical protein
LEPPLPATGHEHTHTGDDNTSINDAGTGTTGDDNTHTGDDGTTINDGDGTTINDGGSGTTGDTGTTGIRTTTLATMALARSATPAATPATEPAAIRAKREQLATQVDLGPPATKARTRKKLPAAMNNDKRKTSSCKPVFRANTRIGF